MDFKIVENSLFARIARMVLKSKNVAMVVGNRIHLSGVDGSTFLNNPEWVAHELCHIKQFQEHGFMRFLWLYLIESWRKGYYNNKYEVEARIAGREYMQSIHASYQVTGQVKPTKVPLPVDVKKTDQKGRS